MPMKPPASLPYARPCPRIHQDIALVIQFDKSRRLSYCAISITIRNKCFFLSTMARLFKQETLSQKHAKSFRPLNMMDQNILYIEGYHTQSHLCRINIDAHIRTDNDTLPRSDLNSGQDEVYQGTRIMFNSMCTNRGYEGFTALTQH